MKKKSGFTLIEMLAVLFIIGIILAIVVPTFNPMTGTTRLKTTADTLANTLESARQYAKTSGIDCYVVFPTTGDNAYRIYKLYSWDGTNPGKSVGKWEMMPVGIQIDPTSTIFTQSGTITIPYPEDTSGSNAVLSHVQFVPSGRANVNASVRVRDNATSSFIAVTFYNYPREIRVRNIGEIPDV
jgi:prepilin-type N-terminal cleavage/methylation domain-containing protein